MVDVIDSEASFNDTLRVDRTMAEAAETDPLGSQFVSLLAQTQQNFRGTYLVDEPTFEPTKLHPAFDFSGTPKPPEQLQLELEILKGKLGSTMRDTSLLMRINGLKAMIAHLTGETPRSLSEIALIAYWFDPYEITRPTMEEIASYRRSILTALPPNHRPNSDDPEAIAEARNAYLKTLRISGPINGDEKDRRKYLDCAKDIVLGRVLSMGGRPVDIVFKPVYPSPAGQDYFYTFTPDVPIIDGHFRVDPDQHPLPHSNIWGLAHEIGHAIHLPRAYKAALLLGHTENAVYAALGPQAVAEGIAEALPYVLFPDADTYMTHVLQLYKAMGQPVNEDDLRHYIENSIYNRTTALSQLNTGDRILWDTYLHYEDDLVQLGDNKAGELFVERYRQNLLTSKSEAERRLQFIKDFGPYIYTYEIYRALVMEQIRGSEQPLEKLFEIMDQV